MCRWPSCLPKRRERHLEIIQIQTKLCLFENIAGNTEHDCKDQHHQRDTLVGIEYQHRSAAQNGTDHDRHDQFAHEVDSQTGILATGGIRQGQHTEQRQANRPNNPGSGSLNIGLRDLFEPPRVLRRPGIVSQVGMACSES